MSFNFKAAVTICSDFGAQENKVCHYLHCFPIYAMKCLTAMCKALTPLSVQKVVLENMAFIKIFACARS